MKILHISDTHGFHYQFPETTWDGVDVVGSWDQWNIELQLVASAKQRLHDLSGTAATVTLGYCVK